MTDKELLEKALSAREQAYAPYSSYKVGAALLTCDGKIYCGCNIENVSFSPTCCAERVAFFKAVSEGEKSFEKIAIVAGKENTDSFGEVFPCGVCRQVMREFCSDDFRIVVGNPESFRSFTLDELIPLGFSKLD